MGRPGQWLRTNRHDCPTVRLQRRFRLSEQLGIRGTAWVLAHSAIFRCLQAVLGPVAWHSATESDCGSSVYEGYMAAALAHAPSSGAQLAIFGGVQSRRKEKTCSQVQKKVIQSAQWWLSAPVV